MPEIETIDYYRGAGERGLAFSDLDQNYRLKHRAFIEICMSPVFEDLERRFKMFALRKKGIVSIMFYLDFQTERTPLSFGRKVQTAYDVSVHRTQPDQGSDAAPRLLLDMRATIKAHRGSGSAASLGFEKEKGPLETVGAGQVLQVFTRPLAAPGERGVTELPTELAEFNLLPWDAPYPTVDMLLAAPQGGTEPQGGTGPQAWTEPPGWLEPDLGNWRETTSVWGMANTDVNQHVNVSEYITHTENHYSRLLHAAGLPLPRHRNRRAQLVFRRPCFGGEPFGMQGRLWVNEQQTVCAVGLHAISPEGEWSPRPSVAARYEGELEEG